MKLPTFLTETEEQRLARQAKQAKELELKKQKEEAYQLRKLKADQWMFQPTNSSTTDSHGHHVVRGWKIVKLTGDN